jgi:thiamine pyrophosphate-dependent acetolactate synthase large subunit-like protein
VEAVIEGLDERTFPYGSEVANEVVDKADVVVAIGTEIGEPMHYGRGRHWARGDADRKWIYIERDPTAIGVNRPVDVPLVGNLTDIVPQLTDALGSTRRDLPADLPKWTAAHEKARQGLFASASTSSAPIHTARLTMEATKVLPKDAVVVRDGGASTMWFSAFMQFPPRDAMWNSNYGAIGPGLPYALGAQMGVGNSRRVVLLTGDSSFMFHIAEIETAVRKNLPIICIVAVDHAWGIEVASYKANYGADTTAPEARWGKAVRFDKAAEAFGAHGEYVEKAEDIGPAVERALASGKPAVIHVEIDSEANSSFVGIPGFTEFRTWYGEDGDNLGFAGTPAAPAATSSAAAPSDKPMDKGAGY